MKLYIFFGSQTGTAEEVAYDLAREATRRLYPLEIWDLNEFPLEDLIAIKLAIFIVSTTGQGEPPDSMKKFWRALMNKHLPVSLFAELNFTVFGLGDSTYDNYNVIARKLFIRLKQLGGTAFHNKGLGDDMHDFGYEAEYHPWCNILWERLGYFFPLFSKFTQATELLPSMYLISQGHIESNFPIGSVKVIENKTISHKYTHTQHFITENLDFSPGDTLAIYPPNNENSVDQLMQRMGWENNIIEIKCNPEHPFIIKSKYPESISLKNLLLWYVDLHKPVSRYFISILAYFAEGLHKEKLWKMSSKTLEGRNEYHRYISLEHRNAVEVLWDFSSISTIPLEYFLEAISLSRCREFSIANYSGNIELLLSIVQFKTPFGRNIYGLCTNYLSELKPGDTIFANVRKARMLVPPLDIPIIYVATGTGLAPIRSVLLYRCANESFKNLLFFGTRHPEHDYYFQDELTQLQEVGKAHIFTAFSQVQPKKYVHDVIKENWQIVIEYLESGAFVLICGKHKQILKNIKNSLILCFKNQKTLEEAENFVKNMEKNNKIYLENW